MGDRYVAWKGTLVLSSKQYCTCCERPLRDDAIVWLELNCMSGQWTDPRVVAIPDRESQGLFPFGKVCARKRLKSMVPDDMPPGDGVGDEQP